ncbi:MAG TPA: CpaD family pilus assembly lipoprotein [Micropepsaceae bacterium]|nr:CpaD family pilus assembly lipoprotein [Micropepsaceae bacterium]
MKNACHSLRHIWNFCAVLGVGALGAGCSTPHVNAAIPTADHPCPAWADFPADRYSNVETAYLGCSVGFNLKTMVDDPHDLESGRTLGPADGARESIAVGQYEAGQTKPLPATGSPTPTFVFSGSNGAAQ